MDAFYEAIRQLPQPILGLLQAVREENAVRVTEIRLRAGRPVALIYAESACYLMPDSSLSQTPRRAVMLTAQQVSDCFLALCSYSVHSVQNQLRQGYLTLAGGHRVGVAGTAVCDGADTIVQLKDITSLNIRVARHITKPPDPRILDCLSGEGGLILAGEPKSGKTTVLRTISGALSAQGAQVAVIDQRRELWPSDAQTVGQLPSNCDILSGYPRADGIIQALRSLSPDVILCDEVGSVEDTAAVRQGANAGVRMIVSIHAGNREDFLRRPQGRLLLETGAFSKLVVLSGRRRPGEVGAVYDCHDLH